MFFFYLRTSFIAAKSCEFVSPLLALECRAGIFRPIFWNKDRLHEQFNFPVCETGDLKIDKDGIQLTWEKSFELRRPF